MWLALVVALTALGYGTRASAGKPDPQVPVPVVDGDRGLIQDAILLLIVLAIAGFSTRLLALRRPDSLWVAARLIATWLVLVLIFESVYARIVHVGNEQGLTPSHWNRTTRRRTSSTRSSSVPGCRSSRS